ncbi:MAG: flagellar brake protein [Rubrivivax sp.]|nr:flagellar brake protein [Rubrivivax sp.]
MFDDTRPAALDAAGSADPWGPFRVGRPSEVLALLRQLRDANAAVVLSAPGGVSYTCTLWAVDQAQGRLNFSADDSHPQLQSLLAANEVVAVAYLDSVKLQFDLQGLLLIRGAQACALQSELPAQLLRFQRRDAYRVRAPQRHAASARLRHPAIPEMALCLRVIDVSIGGCALAVPADVPPLQPGHVLHGVRIELDADTRFEIGLQLHHVTSIQPDETGLRLGCGWLRLEGGAERALQRYIDLAQRRQRLLAPGSA